MKYVKRLGSYYKKIDIDRVDSLHEAAQILIDVVSMEPKKVNNFINMHVQRFPWIAQRNTTQNKVDLLCSNVNIKTIMYFIKTLP